jgi:branched-chain amino acid transport system substrate-binding protein
MHRAILGLICLLGLPGGIAAARAEDAVKIGLLMAYTSQFTDAAAQMDDGIKLYIRQRGDFVAGKRIELIRRDTAGAPDQAKLQFEVKAMPAVDQQKHHYGGRALSHFLPDRH